MSEYKRLRRVLKSLMPDFGGRRRDVDDYYDQKDAINIVNELAMEIPPKVFKGLINSERALDDIITGIYLVEDEIGEPIVNDHKIIDLQFEPKVYIEEGVMGFTVSTGKEEIVFAEFRLNYKKED